MICDYEVPEKAVAAFEKATGLRVCFHDVGQTLGPFLPPERFTHNNPFCSAVKAGWMQACTAFDGRLTHRELAARPEGRVQICHAGLVEWVVPLRFSGVIEGVLFAGQRRAGRGLSTAARDPAPALEPAPWKDPHGVLRLVDDAEAEWLLELARQLAARLQHWRGELAAPRRTRPARDGGGVFDLSDLATRRSLIHAFIHREHCRAPTLQDLARHLHLSESRAGHAIKEACGAPFVKLLSAARLRTAAGLLRHSNLSVLDIAGRSGFNDVSHFHHEFRKQFGTTPHRYRRQIAEHGERL